MYRWSVFSLLFPSLEHHLYKTRPFFVPMVYRRFVPLVCHSGLSLVYRWFAPQVCHLVVPKDVVMSVINALLPEHRQVKDIRYSPTEYQGQLLTNKEFRYDFMCKGMDGTAFIVEVQCYPEQYWFQRCVSYASRVYDRQNKRGEKYDVAPVYLIGLMGTEIEHSASETWENRYISEYTFMEKISHELQDETIIIIFAELASIILPLFQTGA